MDGQAEENGHHFGSFGRDFGDLLLRPHNEVVLLVFANAVTLPQQIRENVFLDRLISIMSASFALPFRGGATRDWANAVIVGGFALPGLVVALALAFWTLQAPWPLAARWPRHSRAPRSAPPPALPSPASAAPPSPVITRESG